MIPIQNIYYMLAYAFQVLQEQEYTFCATEKFENVADLLSAILAKGISSQIKRGLHRDYLSQTAMLICPRGKINIGETINHQTIIQRKLVCTFDEFTENSYHNRILKTTMYVLLHSDAADKRKRDLRNLLRYFSTVELLPVHSIRWDIPFNRNNQTYKMLIAICQMVIEGLLQTTHSGPIKMRQFLDEQRMSHLYEKFILSYYRKEYEFLHPNASCIHWKLESDEEELLLPKMKTDIVLSSDNKYLIIDAKYYSHIMQTQFNTQSFHSQNLYQIFTYVKNLAAQDHIVSGMLLYAQTDEFPILRKKYKYTMSGNPIYIQALDLNRPFSEIKNQLNEIAEEFINS